MKLKSLVKKAAIVCCTLLAFLGLQTAYLSGGAAIASPVSGQILADNYVGGNAPNGRAAANKVREDVKSAFDNVVGSGSANRIEGKAEENYGKVQRNLGNARSQAEGAAKQVQGNAKQATGKAQNAVEGATESVQTAASDAIDAVKDFFNK